MDSTQMQDVETDDDGVEMELCGAPWREALQVAVESTPEPVPDPAANRAADEDIWADGCAQVIRLVDIQRRARARAARPWRERYDEASARLTQLHQEERPHESGWLRQHADANRDQKQAWREGEAERSNYVPGHSARRRWAEVGIAAAAVVAVLAGTVLLVHAAGQQAQVAEVEEADTPAVVGAAGVW